MAIIISGTKLAQEKKEKLKEKIDIEVKRIGRKPNLTVILVGDDPGSISYVKGKEKGCTEVGISINTFHYDNNITEEFLLNKINELNNDVTVDGILVQLPLPKHIRADLVIDNIKPSKDVDGFHPLNVAGLYLKKDCTMPCTPRGIMSLLDSENIPLQGQKAVVVGRSNIVGLPMAKMLLDRNCTVSICHSKTKDLKAETLTADILIAAVGKARLITSDMVKEGAVVIDVGANRDENNKLCGDVDFINVEQKASYITKVPGGVGPMTICTLLESTFEAYLKHNKKED